MKRPVPSYCGHGEEHAEWYHRWADHDAGTVRLEFDCGLCDGIGLARIEPLSDEERDWNDRASMMREAGLSAEEQLRALTRIVRDGEAS